MDFIINILRVYVSACFAIYELGFYKGSWTSGRIARGARGGRRLRKMRGGCAYHLRNDSQIAQIMCGKRVNPGHEYLVTVR